MNQGFLKIMVYQALNEREHSGYSIVKHIHDQTGWKPSFGSIYPLLNSLEHAGDIEASQRGKSKLYKLTASGRQSLSQQQETRKEIYVSIVEHLRCLASMGDTSAGDVAEFLESTTKTGVPIPASTELMTMRRELFRIVKEQKSNLPAFKKTVARTARELKKL